MLTSEILILVSPYLYTTRFQLISGSDHHGISLRTKCIPGPQYSQSMHVHQFMFTETLLLSRLPLTQERKKTKLGHLFSDSIQSFAFFSWEVENRRIALVQHYAIHFLHLPLGFVIVKDNLGSLPFCCCCFKWISGNQVNLLSIVFFTVYSFS